MSKHLIKGGKTVGAGRQATAINSRPATRFAKRGQAAAIDLLVAFILFIALFFVFNDFNNRVAREREDLYGEMLSKAYAIAFVLSESPGFPTDWTHLNFSRPGLVSEPYVLDERKVLNLLAANATAVSQSFGADEFSLRLRVLNTSDDVVLVGGWGDSLGRVAYTLAGHEPNYEGECETGGLRCGLAQNGIPFDNYNHTTSSTDFFNLLGNISNYDTIILEDSHISRSALNTTQRTQFQEWLAGGRTYIHKEHGDIFRLAAANDSGSMSGTPTIRTLGNMLFNVSVGDTLNCDDDQTVNNTSNQAEMANLVKYITDSRNAAVLATWNYGAGRVLFLSDTECSVRGSKRHAHMRFVLTLLGVRGAAGSNPVNATAIAPVVTVTTLNGKTRKLEVTLWKRT